MTVIVENVSKRYWLQGGAPQTFLQALKQVVGLAKTRQPFWALHDVSLRIEASEAVALIGHNGAGKSTLLRLICGLSQPTQGTTQIQGRVTALLELGTGFHANLSGRENVYVSAIVSGFRRHEVEARFNDIVEFAEIGDFIDEPLRTYSSGMQMRLAFAVAMHVDPDILIIDEALAVGDAAFQHKCLERIESFRNAGKTLIFVPHDTSLVRHFCNRAIWLDHGRIERDGPVDLICDAYEARFEEPHFV